MSEPNPKNTYTSYIFQVQDILQDTYFVRIPSAYEDDGNARAYCINFIRVAFETSIKPVDAAFVLCNKIQRKRWLENDHAH